MRVTLHMQMFHLNTFRFYILFCLGFFLQIKLLAGLQLKAFNFLINNANKS